MTRLFTLIIIAAIVFAIAYFQMKSIPMIKKMAIIGGGFAAALIGVSLQMIMPSYMAFLAMLAVALLAALLYMKHLEKEQQENQRLAEERREKRQHLIQLNPARNESSPVHTDTLDKSFSMQSINPDRKEL